MASEDHSDALAFLQSLKDMYQDVDFLLNTRHLKALDADLWVFKPFQCKINVHNYNFNWMHVFLPPWHNYSSQPFEGENTNEEFLEITQSYFAIKIAAESTRSSLREDLMKPHKISKQVFLFNLLMLIKILLFLIMLDWHSGFAQSHRCFEQNCKSTVDHLGKETGYYREAERGGRTASDHQTVSQAKLEQKWVNGAGIYHVCPGGYMSYLINHVCVHWCHAITIHVCIHQNVQLRCVHIHQLERLYISYMIHMHACVYTLIHLYVIWLHLLYKTER